MRFLYLLFLLFIVGCYSSDDMLIIKNYGEAQGTYYHIQYFSYEGVDYQAQIDSILLEIDSSLSIYKDYSLISRLNNGEDIKTDPLFNDVYYVANQVYKESLGNFDCSIYPLVEAWGFYKDKNRDSINIDSIKVNNILSAIGFDRTSLVNDSLVLPDGMFLDFNSLAQGYAVDLIADFLESKGENNYLVEIGGEVLAKGKNADNVSWRVGVDKPTDSINLNQRFLFILDLDNKALATSGNYRNFYEEGGVKYAHTINPFTGFPARNRLLSVTVMHDNCMLADAYATAFMVMGVRKSKKFVQENPDIEVYLVYTERDRSWSTFISPGMREQIVNSVYHSYISL